ncbi:transporter [Desulfovibrio litoralis]|uniref:MetA-pathway of phenol degradation n=1 Tax=Desulfovibrio litoralis DSM 11393 TaxID=1121455 RepID=A0A1M7RZ74_9BACT|nr:transporter [Desulfovibrio litoralis]SHN51434.1 hypothetical protein SAMN02745728_00349 [Desulfovibrio litoralis DSM 11393]
MNYQKHMKKTLLIFSTLCFLYSPALSQEAGETPKNTKQQKTNHLLGAPVNVGASSNVVIPKGVLLISPNYSIREKYSSSGPGNKQTPNVDSSIFITKIRYGLADRVELRINVPYTTFTSHAPKNGPVYNRDGFGDINIMGAYQITAQKFGDPVTTIATLGVGLPTAEKGKSTSVIPGNASWSGIAKTGIRKDFNQTHRLETELSYTLYMNEGNLDTKKGDVLMLNSQYRYMTQHNFDIGIENIIEKTFSSEVKGRNQKDDSFSCYVGPSVNVSIPVVDMWVGAGVFAGVVNDNRQRKPVEDYRVDFKVGKFFF